MIGRNDLYNALYSYLKLDRGNTIQTSRFAEAYMDDEVSEQYLQHMRQERFPTAAIAKDLSEVDGSLRWRKLRFPRQITLTGPPDAVWDLVSIELTNGEDGNPWTRVLIRGRIESQE